MTSWKGAKKPTYLILKGGAPIWDLFCLRPLSESTNGANSQKIALSRLRNVVFLWKNPKNVFVGKSPTSVTTPALPLLLPYGTQNRDFFQQRERRRFFKAKPASWKVIINYLLGVSLVQLLPWIQWERQGVPLLTQQSPSLMVILQIVNLLDDYCHVSAPPPPGDCQQCDSLQRHLVRP